MELRLTAWRQYERLQSVLSEPQPPQLGTTESANLDDDPGSKHIPIPKAEAVPYKVCLEAIEQRIGTNRGHTQWRQNDADEFASRSAARVS